MGTGMVNKDLDNKGTLPILQCSDSLGAPLIEYGRCSYLEGRNSEQIQASFPS
jgi:hypothetical protein